MEEFRPSGFRILTPVVKNILIINALFFIGTYALAPRFDFTEFFGLHYFTSPMFRPHQLVTYMFMHGGFTHILFNMFAVWMFGNVLENVWGPKRFLTYYMVTGIGAGLIQLLVLYFRISSIESTLDSETITYVQEKGYQLLMEGKNWTDPVIGKLNLLINTTTIGASGAVFGILLAFGMMFPNSLIYVYFAIPVKAKYFVMIYGAIELFSGISGVNDNVAHFAHLGGMIFGYFLLLYWKKR